MRTGRPKKEHPKSVKYSIRLEKQTEEELIEYCNKRAITKGEAIRRAVHALLWGEK